MIYIGAKKRAIPQEVRRAAARRAGATGIGTWTAHCTYCGKRGVIHWITPSWVRFRGLELDHVVPEYRGGQATEDNIVLTCQRCNCSKGFRRPAPITTAL